MLINTVLPEAAKPEQTKTATPSLSQQTISPDSGKVLSGVTVEPITAALLTSLDPDFKPENIAKDADLFGLVGTHEGADVSEIEYTYSGSVSDEITTDGTTGQIVRKLTFNTSGVFKIIRGTIDAVIEIVAGGGGAVRNTYAFFGKSSYQFATGGGGGHQTVAVTLTPGGYVVQVGVGGSSADESGTEVGYNAGAGGTTSAFGYTSTGGEGGYVYFKTNAAVLTPGAGGTPNGGVGTSGAGEASVTYNYFGGSPNGGAVVDSVPQPGGNGFVRITFS